MLHGRGNKSSGDNFHAAPNVDHSQDFVRKDIKEWLHWLKEEIGYDGWRLDFVRGFWGGYVKDYLEASKPATVPPLVLYLKQQFVILAVVWFKKIKKKKKINCSAVQLLPLTWACIVEVKNLVET
ncbi:unnamed protein product [Fraxinus pennsylvanica]|uniref:1,4-alpha-D-glucan glucanohydrolase n=1 Tax=Fraxinus pennsylvanica TaxID=56036 RepID=A0AAD1Z799_9LAMI|nr:unnamed protein product [Fraxinus pennsylvanica]